MTGPSANLSIAVLCSPDSQLASIAPFGDLARLSDAAKGKGKRPVATPVIRVDLVHGTAAPPHLERARPMRLASEQTRYDAIVVAAGYDLEENPPEMEDKAAADWLRERHEGGAYICGVGSGVLSLAQAGLLDGRQASLPPRRAAMIRRAYPRIKMAHGGDIEEQDRILTAAEPSSVFALAIILTRRIHSHSLAERYRRACCIPETEVPEHLFPVRKNQDMLVADVRAWIIAHMQDEFDVARIAKRFGVSARTLSRRFERAVGMTPARFLRVARVDAAASMLRRTRFSVEQIASLVGYRDVSFFRDVFRTELGMTPRDYRMAPVQSR